MLTDTVFKIHCTGNPWARGVCASGVEVVQFCELAKLKDKGRRSQPSGIGRDWWDTYLGWVWMPLTGVTWQYRRYSSSA